MSRKGCHWKQRHLREVAKHEAADAAKVANGRHAYRCFKVKTLQRGAPGAMVSDAPPCLSQVPRYPRPSVSDQASATKHLHPHAPTPGMLSVSRAMCSFTRFTPKLSQRGVWDLPWSAIAVGERMRAWRAWREVAP